MKSGVAVYIVTTNLSPYDAIGADVLGMAESLSRAGYRAEVYAADVHPSLAGVARTLAPATNGFWNDSNGLLIYHHSMGWPAGQQLLESTRKKVVVKYHNITPPRFFEPYSQAFAEACRTGEQANFRVASHRTAIFWGDSAYNCADLGRYGAPPERCRVLAPFHRTEDMADVALDRKVLDGFKGKPGAKILFVGGIKPNKGHLHLLRVVAAYQRKYDSEVTLFLPGGIDPRLDSYTRHLRDVIGAYGIAKNVVFPGSVSASELKTYFFISDLFLCLSEHEGFCVPLIEAMYCRVPVIAASTTAVPETVGDAGILWPEDPLDVFVESVAVCMDDHDARRQLQSAGRLRFETLYRRETLSAKLLELVEEALA
jgi:glycosyltransferase involved in cell wall biosynthesis